MKAKYKIRIFHHVKGHPGAIEQPDSFPLGSLEGLNGALCDIAKQGIYSGEYQRGDVFWYQVDDMEGQRISRDSFTV
jgi:hypothetical protein